MHPLRSFRRHSADSPGHTLHRPPSGQSCNIDMPLHDSSTSESGTKGANRVFYQLNDCVNVDEVRTIIIFFHGLVRDGRYAEDSEPFKGDTIQEAKWLGWLDSRPHTRVYIASYKLFVEAYEKRDQADLYVLGDILLEGVKEVLEIHKKTWDKCNVILIGHSVGGLAIKQLILQAEGSSSIINQGAEEDLGLRFLNRIAGVFYLSTPHSELQDLTRILGKSKSLVGTALAALGKVTDRLNSQFMERRKALAIPTAEVSETLNTRVGRFNGLVVSEASARMDVDLFIPVRADHFDVSEIEEESDPRYEFLLQQIEDWVHSGQSRTRAMDPDSGC